MTHREECATSTNGYEYLSAEQRAAARAWDATLRNLDKTSSDEIAELVASLDDDTLSGCSLGLRIACLSPEDQVIINSLVRESRVAKSAATIVKEVLHG